MKSLVAILLVIVMAVMFVGPVMAADPSEADTTVTVGTGGGEAPVVKAKWEWATPIDSENSFGDDEPTEPGLQLAHPGVYGGTRTVHICAVVQDYTITNMEGVWAKVFHPLYNASWGPPLDGTEKWQTQLTPFGDGDLVITAQEKLDAISAISAADAACLMTYNDGFDLQDLIDEINEDTAWLWCGEGIVEYHQPFGNYKVSVTAWETGHIPSAALENFFEYEETTACEFDFTAVNYGSASVSVEKKVEGDYNWGTGGPTMRNLGNTWLHVEVQQDDMAFGFSGSPPPAPGNWKVEFDARLGNSTENSKIVYDPAFAKGAFPGPQVGKWTALPNLANDYPAIVKLCNTWKIDFSIHIKFAELTSYSGKMWLRCVYEQFTGPNTPHP
jgi:hypothetical protein